MPIQQSTGSFYLGGSRVFSQGVDRVGQQIGEDLSEFVSMTKNGLGRLFVKSDGNSAVLYSTPAEDKQTTDNVRERALFCESAQPERLRLYYFLELKRQWKAANR